MKGILIMIVLRKRFLLFGILGILTIGTIYKLKIQDNELNEVVALPVNEKVIIIDAGHGGEDRWSNIYRGSF